jgi:hypothetical protein
MNGQDVMSVTFSVNDETVQVTRVEGILRFVLGLPQFKTMKDGGELDSGNLDLMNMLSSWIGDDVRGCLVEAAVNYTDAAQEVTRPKEQKQEIDPSKELLNKMHKEKESAVGVVDGEDPFGYLDEGIPDLELLRDVKNEKSKEEMKDLTKNSSLKDKLKEQELQKRNGLSKRHLHRHQHYHQKIKV